MIKQTSLAAMLILSSFAVSAHPGKTNSEGCHKEKSTGIEHCHAKKPTKEIVQETNIISEAEYRRTMLAETYNRDDWPHWKDLDGDCEDARAEALIAANKGDVMFDRRNKCEVKLVSIYDPYTDKEYYSAKRLDIDHIVPLSEAHQTGGAEWSKEQKTKFANDLSNLIPVYAGANRSKGDRHPAEWMPENESYHCEYLEKWIGVKKSYGLEIRESTLSIQSEKCGG